MRSSGQDWKFEEIGEVSFDLTKKLFYSSKRVQDLVAVVRGLEDQV